MADQKNLFLAIALSLVILITWNVMVEQPKIEREKAAFEQQQAAERAAKAGGATTPATTGQAAAPGAPVTGPAAQSPVHNQFGFHHTATEPTEHFHPLQSRTSGQCHQFPDERGWTLGAPLHVVHPQPNCFRKQKSSSRV